MGFCPRVCICRIWFSIHCVSWCSFQASHFTPVVHFVLLYALDCWAGLPVYRHWWGLYMSSMLVDVRHAFVRWLHKSLFVIILLLLSSSLEVLTTCLTDAFPKFLSNKRILVTGPTCLVLYLLGLPCVSRVGLVYLLVPLPLMSASSLSVVCGCVCVPTGGNILGDSHRPVCRQLGAAVSDALWDHRRLLHLRYVPTFWRCLQPELQPWWALMVPLQEATGSLKTSKWCWEQRAARSGCGGELVGSASVRAS